MKTYDIDYVIDLRDNQKLKWQEIEDIIGVSHETLRKQYAKIKKGNTSTNPNSYPN